MLSASVQKLKLSLPLVLLAVLQACASAEGTNPQTERGIETAGGDVIEPTVVSYQNYNDPLMGMNRAIFQFNDFSYRHAIIPLSEGYLEIVPPPVRDGITNVFDNIKTPIYFVNNLIQGRVSDSLTNLARFSINSTIGILGIMDPARDAFGLEPAHTGFEDTLSHFGSGYGVYVVLPLIGATDLRNSVGRVGDYFLNPIVYLTDNPERLVIQGVDGVNTFAPQAVNYLELKEQADDPYLFFRNMYLQGVIRDAEYVNAE